MRACRRRLERVCLVAALGLAACSSDELLKIQLQPPPGAAAVALGTKKEGADLEVVAVDLDEPGEWLPNAVDDGEQSYTFTARYFESLESAGVPPGRLTPLSSEPVFGPIPYQDRPDSVLTVGPEGVSEWLPAKGNSMLDGFLSAALPIDEVGCFELESIALLPFGSSFREVAASGRVALVSTFSSLSTVREGVDGWQLSLLDEASPMSQALAGSIPRTMVGDASGRFYLGTSLRGNPRILVGGIDEEIEVISVPSPPGTELDQILPSEGEIVLLTSQGTILWLAESGGKWTATASIAAAGIRQLARTSDGRVFGLSRGLSGTAYRVVGTDAVVEEPLNRPSDESLVQILSVDNDVFVASFRDFIINPGLIYRWASAGEWELLDDKLGGNELLAMHAARSGLFLTSLFGGVTYFSPRDGQCEQNTPFTSGLYAATEIAALDATTFIAGGKSISAANDFEDSLSIFRVTSRRP